MAVNQSAIPPRSLILLILGITVVALATLLWLGWRLLEQDRLLESQQVQQRVERAADLVVAALQRTVSASEQRLAAATDLWPEGAVEIAFRDGVAEAHPAERVAHLPAVRRLPEAPSTAFAEGDDLEFHRRDHLAAIGFFRALAKSPDPAVAAGALIRLARNLQHAGRSEEALATYARLSSADRVAIAGAPAALVARYARCKLLEESGRGPELRAEAQRLAAELDSGHWPLTAPVYWLYAGDAARWSGDGPNRPRQAEVFADAAAALWERWSSLPAKLPAASGRESLAAGGQTVSVLWQTSGGSFRALLAAPAFVESGWLVEIAPVIRQQRVSLTLRDAQGKIVFGPSETTQAHKATRSAAEAALPWSVAATSLLSPGQDGDFALRRRLLIAGFVLLVAMAMAASYVIFRAVSRELAVARVQSDFVAAVSHEFRTPLTALRQFTDMLRDHATLTDDRRRVCYDAQARATDRLTRLVESLLDFGRMEAGARRYEFEDRDCLDLVQRVVEDFRAEAHAAGHEIAFHGNGSAPIAADSEALSRAVWNLLENAVKYSAPASSIEVELKRRDTDITIAVRDRGIGIPPHEQASIFAKFQRGEEARARGIKGTGIGLAMVDQIVKAHHGRIELESQPGKGSTFTMVLPVKE